MKIEILYFSGCPNHPAALAQVQHVLHSKNMNASIKEIEVTDPVMAQKLAFLGSPSIRVNGLDVEPDARSITSFGFGCRTYPGEGRSAGIPSIEVIRQAIVEATQPRPK